MLTSPLYVLTNALGLIVALWTSGGTSSSLETTFITFSYYTLVTRVVWQFNRIYRNLEVHRPTPQTPSPNCFLIRRR